MYVNQTKTANWFGYLKDSILLEGIPELQNPFDFELKTNATVRMSFEVWNINASGQNYKLETFNALDIPFNTTLPGPSGKFRKLMTSSHGGYYIHSIDITMKITCAEHFGGMGCNYCLEEAECNRCDIGYFGVGCKVFCAPTEHYHCSSAGGKVCRDGRVGNNCVKPRSTAVTGKGLAIGIGVIPLIAVVLALVVLKLCNSLRVRGHHTPNQGEETETESETENYIDTTM